MIDLHTHSTFSDGTLSPTALMELAADAGLSAVALTDHNTTAGLPEFLQAAQGKNLRAIPGVEFSTDYNGGELHLLALFLPQKHWAEAEAMLSEMLQRKEQSNRDLVENLKTAGIVLDYEKIRSASPSGVVNRAVIAAEMTKLGYTASVQEAFEKWLRQKHGFFHPPQRLDVFAVIRQIRAWGAVSVLAHPFLNLKEESTLRQFLQLAVPAGLHGMETLYSKFDRETTALARSLAREYSLAESGGSDFHGENKPDIRIGVGRGELAVPEAFLTALEKHCFSPAGQ